MFRRLALLAALSSCLFPAFAQSHQRPMSPEQQKDMAELQAYTLTMDKLTRASKATFEMNQMAKADPALKAKMNSDNDDAKSISQMTARMQSFPQAVAVLSKNGLTPHEYADIVLTMIQAGFAAAAVEMSHKSVAEIAAQAHVNPANITLMQQHKAEIEELQKKYPMTDSSD